MIAQSRGQLGPDPRRQGHGETQIIRPRAVKATTIHPRVITEFHGECQDAGIPECAAIHAVEQASEWHRRWVMQEEEGHTMPHDDGQWSDIDEFRLGAKNPSLSDQSDDGQSPEPNVIQQVVGAPILRPIALRPQEAAPSPLHLHQSGFESPHSPLTLPSEHYGSADQYPVGEQYGPVVFDELSFESLSTSIPSVIHPEPQPTVDAAKENLLHALAITGGDVESKAFEEALLPLMHHYEETGWDARDPEGIYAGYANTRKVEGMWLTLSKPTYFGNLGETANGDPMYTLGRMAFDMFLPTQLVCSLQGNFNPVNVLSAEEREAVMERCPKSLVEEVATGGAVLRQYNIVTAFTIEPHLADFPDAPNKDVRRPIKGIMTTYGYILPDPAVPNRLSIWFTGGRIEPNDDSNDQREWKRLFSRPLQQRTFGEKVRLFAANLLMGAEAPSTLNDDGSMEFEFTRPLGGHGVAYVDVVYLDDTLRIVRGHRGTVFAFVRIPDNSPTPGC